VTAPQNPNSFRTGPDERGRFGIFGGRVLGQALRVIERARPADVMGEVAVHLGLEGRVGLGGAPAVTAPQNPNSFRTGPDERGRFGIFGGRFVAERRRSSRRRGAGTGAPRNRAGSAGRRNG
jgi:hypothetical protein